MIPRFSFDQTVTAETAKHDHLYVTFGEWLLQGSTNDIDALRERLAAPEEYERGEVSILDPTVGRIFNRPQRNGSNRPPLSVRTTPLALADGIIPRNLFSGALKINNYVRPDMAADGQVFCRLKLHLNPTRFVRYQPRVSMPASTPSSLSPAAVLASDRAPNHFNDEIVLNDNDNWLPNTQRMAAFANPTRWQSHLRSYIQSVTGLFESELARCNAIAPVAAWNRVAERLNLETAEVYWEFASENPTALVATLQPLLNSFTAGHRESTEFRQNCDHGINHNAISLRAEISRGRSLRIYAKTNRRIRIEVIYQLSGERGFPLDGGHTANEWQQLRRMLSRLSENAAELVNRLFTHFNNQTGINPSHITAYQLLLEIAEHSRHPPTALTLTSLLIHNNCIAAGGMDEHMLRAIHRLSGAEVIQYQSASQTYVVTAARRHALHSLRSNASFSLLGRRRRQHPSS